MPKEGVFQQEFSMAEWMREKRPVWDSICEKHGVPEAKASFDAAGWDLLVCRSSSIVLEVSANTRTHCIGLGLPPDMVRSLQLQQSQEVWIHRAYRLL
jgi:hypothetical protein